MPTEKQFQIVPKAFWGMRLDQCLSRMFPHTSRGQARRAITDGEVWINGKKVRIQSRKVHPNDRITWAVSNATQATTSEASSVPSEPTETQAGQKPRHRKDSSVAIDWEMFGGRPEFLFRDNYLAVVNKPAGTPTEPTKREDLRTCLRQVETVLREEGLMEKRLYVTAVHRLDAPASGALAFALRKQAARELSAQFATRTAKRLYYALVAGHLEEEEGEIKHHLGWVGPGVTQGVVSEAKGKHAITNYKVVREVGPATLVELSLQTGRTHQIRVQMAAIGHPLLGDWLYCPPEIAEQYPKLSRTMLHAHTLTLQHPTTQKSMTFEAPIPEDFSSYLEQVAQLEAG